MTEDEATTKGEPPLVEEQTEQEQPNSEDAAAAEQSEQPIALVSVSHLTRQDLSPLWRYGVVVYLLAVMALLLASDIGSGVQAITITIPASGDIWSVSKETIVSDESIFSSVRLLWDTGSYALAVFIAVTSICWPYVKLILTLYAWVVPFQVEVDPLSPLARRVNRRERMVQVLDALGKWSFADVLVFCQILVAFRATIPVGAGTTLEVYILSLWGFYGFVAATMLGLIGTHAILYHHRQYLYHSNSHSNLNSKEKGEDSEDPTQAPEEPQLEQPDPTNFNVDLSAQPQQQPTSTLQHWTNMTVKERFGFIAGLLIALILYIVGCSLPIFEVSRQRGDVETTYVDFSILTVGAEYMDLTKEAHAGDRWLQIVWFLLTFVLPIIATMFLCALLLLSNDTLSTQRRREQWYFCSEIVWCWSCAEVTVLSTLFAVLQIPQVGTGLVDSGCHVCYVFGSTLLMQAFVPLAIGALMQAVLAIWLFRRVHRALYCQDDCHPGAGTSTTSKQTMITTTTKTEEEVQ